MVYSDNSINSSLFDLRGKTALITGSTRGIGRATAEHLARHGANVVITSRKPDECETVAASIRAAGGNVNGQTIVVDGGYSIHYDWNNG